MRTLLINYNKNSGIVFCKIKTPYKSENRRENKIILSSYSLLLFEPLCVVAFTIRSCVHLRKLQSLSQRYPRTHAFIIARMLASEPDANSMYPIICTQISQFSFQMILLRYLFVRNERRKSLAFRPHVLSYSTTITKLFPNVSKTTFNRRISSEKKRSENVISNGARDKGGREIRRFTCVENIGRIVERRKV